MRPTPNDFERQNLFMALSGLQKANREASDPRVHLDELEAIAMHSESRSTRLRAQQALNEHRAPAVAAG